MKITSKRNRILGFNIEHSHLDVSQLLEKMIELLRSSVTASRHVLPHIAAGLEKMLAKMTAETDNEHQVRALRTIQSDHISLKNATTCTPAPDVTYGAHMIAFVTKGRYACTPETQKQDVFGDGSTIMNDRLL